MGLLARIERMADVPTPSVASFSNWLALAFGGLSSTDSGVKVTEWNAQRVSTWWACRKVIAETLASVPLITYKTSGGGKQRAESFPIYSLLYEAPNTEMTSFAWRELAGAHVVDWGNHYSEIELDGAGRPIGLWPLMPDRTRAERRRVVDSSGRTVLDENGLPQMVRVVVTWVPGPGGVDIEQVLPASRVLHIAGMGHDGMRGYSPVQMARQSLGLALAAEEFGARWFGSGSRPSGVLEYPARLKAESRDAIRTTFEAMHQGLSQSHRIAVLEQGLTFKQTSVNPNDSQFIETRQIQVPEICRWHRMPPHMVQDLSRGTFSNIEVQSTEFVRFTMLPWFVRFETALKRALLTPAQRKQYSIRFLIEGLLRGALKERYDAYAIGRQWGWLCADDVRELEDMNLLPDGLGQQFLVPMNMIPADQAANLGQKPEKPAGGDSSGGGEDDDADPNSDPGADGSPQMKAREREMPLLGILDAAQEAKGESGQVDTEQLAASLKTRIAAGLLVARGGSMIKARQRRSAEMRNKHRKAFLPAFKDVGEDLVKQLTKAVRSNLKKSRNRRDDGTDGALSLASFNSGMESFTEGFAGTAKRKMQPVVQSFGTAVRGVIGDEIGQEIDGGSLEKTSETFAEGFAASFLGSAMGQLRALINDNVSSPDDTTVGAISQRLDEWESTWPDKIANRESVRANGAISRETYQSAGVTSMVWVCGSKPCDLCSPRDGQVVSTTENFASAGDVVDPGPDSGTAPLTVREDVPYPPLHGDGCECSISAA